MYIFRTVVCDWIGPVEERNPQRCQTARRCVDQLKSAIQQSEQLLRETIIRLQGCFSQCPSFVMIVKLIQIWHTMTMSNKLSLMRQADLLSYYTVHQIPNWTSIQFNYLHWTRYGPYLSINRHNNRSKKIMSLCITWDPSWSQSKPKYNALQ